MEITGEQIVPTTQQRVWEALNDPAILKQCIAGCESIEKVADNEYKVAMTAAIGPVKAKFAGKLLLADLNPPSSYSLSFEGSGGAAGFGKGSAKVNLAPADAGTRLQYNAVATVGGKLAQVGARLIDGVAKKMADDFFTKFNAVVAPAGAAAAPEAAPASVVKPAAPREPVAAAGNPMWIVFVLIVAMVVLARLYGGAH